MAHEDQVDSATLMERYLATHSFSHEENQEHSSPDKKVAPETVSSDRVQHRKRKGISGMIIKKVFDDVTNKSPSKAPHTITKGSPSASSAEAEDQLHSLTSPSKEALHAKKRKELKQQIVLLTERVNCMEDNQIENMKAINNMRDKLAKSESTVQTLQKEKESLATENEALKKQVEQLKADLDRHITSKWKSVVNTASFDF